jgi:Flp pilus assembly protein TadD
MAHAGWEEGVAAFKAQNWAQAAQEFQAVVEASPEYAGGHQMLGQSLLKLNRSQEALTHLRKAYDLGPDNIAVQMVLGQAYVQTGRYRDAAELLGNVNAASLPKAQQGALHQMLAIALDKTGQSSSAIREMERAVALDPNDAGLQYQLGTLLFNNGDTAQAVGALEKAASLDSGDSRKQKAYADALLRSAREQQGSAKEATYRKAVSAASRLVTAEASYDNLMLLGGAQLGAGVYTEAASTFQRAAGQNARDWLPQFYIGQAQTSTGNFTAAEGALQKALSLTESQTDRNRIWNQLGFVYEKQKNWPQAKTAYGKAGNSGAISRVEQNEATHEFNAEVEAERAEIEKLKAEEEELEKKLRELEGDTPPRD